MTLDINSIRAHGTQFDTSQLSTLPITVPGQSFVAIVDGNYASVIPDDQAYRALVERCATFNADFALYRVPNSIFPQPASGLAPTC